ncbi:DUF3000 domain-containing protein [soil metagenome]
MVVPGSIQGPPADFLAAVDEVRGVPLRSEVIAEEMPAPQRIAPHAYAMTGDVVVDDDELATGRFILLHDPKGNDAWNGTYRCVTFARADIETEMAVDPMLPAVGWSWLTDALDHHQAAYREASGSVTIVHSESFGEMTDNGSSAQIEVRASWTPESTKGAHAAAWADLLCMLAGLPPLTAGVTPLPNRRGQR